MKAVTKEDTDSQRLFEHQKRVLVSYYDNENHNKTFCTERTLRQSYYCCVLASDLGPPQNSR